MAVIAEPATHEESFDALNGSIQPRALLNLRYGHSGVAQIERHVLRQCHIKSHFNDVELLGTFQNQGADHTEIANISGGLLNEALARPRVVRHALLATAALNGFFRAKEIKQHFVNAVFG